MDRSWVLGETEAIVHASGLQRALPPLRLQVPTSGAMNAVFVRLWSKGVWVQTFDRSYQISAMKRFRTPARPKSWRGVFCKDEPESVVYSRCYGSIGLTSTVPRVYARLFKRV